MSSQPVSRLSATADTCRDSASLNDLISHVYDSVFDQSRWESAFARIARYVGGAGAGLFAKNHDSEQVRIQCRFGIVRPPPSPPFTKICPTVARHFLGQTEQPVVTSDLMPFDQLARTESYQS